MLSHSIRRASAVALVLASLLTGTTRVVSAHAQYTSSTPFSGATVTEAPTVVLITFTQELADIKISITAPDGSDVTTSPAKFDLANRHNASVPMRNAGAGQYTVVWHNVSGDDGDPNDGSFPFTVAGASAAAPVEAPAPAAPAANAPAAATPVPAAPACVENGQVTPGVTDVRIHTHRNRPA